MVTRTSTTTAHLMVRRRNTDFTAAHHHQQQQQHDGDDDAGFVGDVIRKQQQQQQSSGCYCSLEVSICNTTTDICRLKGTLTSRRTGSTLREVQLDLSGLFYQNQIRNKKLRPIFKALGDLPLLETLKFHYNQRCLERLPVHLIQIALLTRDCSNNNNGNGNGGSKEQEQQGGGSGGNGNGNGSGLKILEFHQVNLTGTSKEFDVFYDTIRNHCISLEVFSFSTSGISSSSNINELLVSLSVCPNLQKVSLYSEKGRSPWGKLCGSAIRTLVSSSSSSRTITTSRLEDFQHLVLYDSGTRRGNFFTDEHTIALAQGLQLQQAATMSSSSLSSSNPQQQQQQQSSIVAAPPPVAPNNNNNNTLKEVMISCWPLGRAGVRALCQMLPNNRSLRKLTIVIYELGEDNNTEDTCYISNLASTGCLGRNCTLQSLELHHTSMELGKWIAEPFWNLLADTNYTIRHLKLSSNDDALFCKPYLDFYLKLNGAGRYKLLRGGGGGGGGDGRPDDDTTTTPTRMDWINSMIRVRNDISCLFYFLSTNPLLCSE